MENSFIFYLEQQIFLNPSAVFDELTNQFEGEIKCSQFDKNLAYDKMSLIVNISVKRFELMKNDGIMEVL